MKFRKKPAVIEAMQFTGQNAMEVSKFCGVMCSGPDINPVTFLDVHTLEGVMRADMGDWIIRGVKGEFYPCKPDIFAQTYEVIPSGNLLADDATRLCWEIEALPASTQQTDISCKMVAFHARCQAVDAAIAKALDLLDPPFNGPAIQARRVLQSVQYSTSVSTVCSGKGE